MCSECKRIICPSSCPNFEPKIKAKHYCSVCEEGIYDGDEYVKNDDDEYRHYDCFNGVTDLLEWLGYKLETMGDD